jgi:plastocyanin
VIAARRRLLAGAVCVLAGTALVGAVPAGAGPKPVRKTVKVFDNYFLPAKLTVPRGSTITWKWPSSDLAGDVHDVELDRRPRGVKKFASDPAASDYTFRRKFTVPGSYRVICTLHEEMTMTLRVR